jgi:hypothetical protein
MRWPGLSWRVWLKETLLQVGADEGRVGGVLESGDGCEHEGDYPP